MKNISKIIAVSEILPIFAIENNNNLTKNEKTMKKGETNNKRVLLLALIALFVWTAHIVAEPITKQQAQEIVQEYLVKRGKNITVSNLRHAPLRQAATTESFYVFNVGNNEGFVIAAGDDCAPAILGYSNVGSFDAETMPDNMKAWLEEYDRQIKFMQEHGQSSKGILKTPTRAAIAPLVNAKWSQDAPYNSMCPDVNYIDYDEAGYDISNRCPTGCVATAMAQLMYYWEWPKDCPAINGYEVDGHTIKALPATTFKWGKMKDTYSDNETGEAADAVAELMRYCGQAIKTHYDRFSSGANLSSATMVSTFQYSSDMKELSRDGYTASEWESFMYEELLAERPVLYSGYTSSGSGHQFIIDGYDGAGLFHINWGWGGYPDTYFALSVTEGSDAPVIGYQTLQTALIGVEPSMVAEETVIVDNVAYICNTVKKTAKVIASDDVDCVASSVTIQQTVNANGVDCKVVAISDGAFARWRVIKEVVIPEGVETIGAGAFYWCFNLRKIVFPSTITYIGENAFEGDDVLTVVESHIPNPLDINKFTFYGNASLNPITGEFEVQSTLATLYVPVGCKSKYEALPGWKQFRKIEEGEQKEAKIGDLKYWYPSAGSTAIVVPDDSYMNLTTVSIPATVEIENKIYQVKDIGSMAFNYSQYLKSISFAEGIETIGASALSGLYSITEITLPQSLKIIGFEAFYQSHIKSLVIPEGVEIIYSNAFNSESLRMLELPNSLKYLGGNLIYGNQQLVSVVSNIIEPFAIYNGTFVCYADGDGIPSPATLYVPIGTKAKYESLPGWTKFAKIEENEQKEIMVGGVRYGYSTGAITATVVNDDSYRELTAVTIPEDININGKTYEITAIGKAAFKNANISEITLPSTLREIGESAFEGCSFLKKIVIPEGVKKIGDLAFADMKDLLRLELPISIRSFGKRLIFGNTNMTSVLSNNTDPFAIDDDTFVLDNNNTPSPATLYVPVGTKAKYEAFSGWTKFIQIEEDEQKETMVGNLKYSYSTGGAAATVLQDESYKNLAEVTIPAIVNIDTKTYQVTVIGNSAFRNCSLTSVSLPETIEVIDDNAFERSGLSEITFPKSLKKIGKEAFYCCSHIKTLIIPDGVETIGNMAFANMNNLEKLELPKTLKYIGFLVIRDNENLTSVVSHITDPYNVGNVDKETFVYGEYWDSGFKFIPSPATLYVPAGTKAKYEALSGWTMFADIVEIQGIDPVTEEEVSFGDIINETTDLSDTVIENIYYNLDEENGDGYDATTQALVLNSATTAEQMNAIQDAEIGSVAISEYFNGIIFELPKGSGTITVDAQTIGTHVLNVQLGNNAPTKVTKAERGMAEVPFDVETPTYVYLYASSEESNGARTSHTPSAAANSVLLYGFMVAVEAEPVIVTANSYTREYGEENPVFKYTVEGAALEGEPQITCEATKTSPVGTYPIVITKGSVTNDNDTYINGTLTIEKAPLTVKAEDASRTEGEENPTFVISYEGWKNGETEDVLTVKPTATTDATQSSPAGTYVIVVSGGDAQNYELLYQNGTLTVKEASCIYSISNSQSNMPTDVYDLQGRIVNRNATTLKNLPRGIYVVNGRKMVVK